MRCMNWAGDAASRRPSSTHGVNVRQLVLNLINGDADVQWQVQAGVSLDSFS